MKIQNGLGTLLLLIALLSVMTAQAQSSLKILTTAGTTNNTTNQTTSNTTKASIPKSRTVYDTSTLSDWE